MAEQQFKKDGKFHLKWIVGKPPQQGDNRPTGVGERGDRNGKKLRFFLSSPDGLVGIFQAEGGYVEFPAGEAWTFEWGYRFPGSLRTIVLTKLGDFVTARFYGSEGHKSYRLTLNRSSRTTVLVDMDVDEIFAELCGTNPAPDETAPVAPFSGGRCAPYFDTTTHNPLPENVDLTCPVIGSTNLSIGGTSFALRMAGEGIPNLQRGSILLQLGDQYLSFGESPHPREARGWCENVHYSVSITPEAWIFVDLEVVDSDHPDYGKKCRLWAVPHDANSWRGNHQHSLSGGGSGAMGAST